MPELETKRGRAATRADAEPGARRSPMVVGTLGFLVGALVAAALGFAGFALVGGERAAGPVAVQPQRGFMFEVLGVTTPNQGGQRLNLYFAYRYNPGIAERDIPDYRKLRTAALEYLRTTDLSRNPYWETLNHEMCGRLKNGYPLEAISCQIQVVGNDDPNRYEPGYHSSVETFGDIAPMSLPGPHPVP